VLFQGGLVILVRLDLCIGALEFRMSAPSPLILSKSRTARSCKNGSANFLRTWLISVKSSSERKRGRHRLNIECATSKTPLLTLALSGVSLATKSCDLIQLLVCIQKREQNGGGDAHVDQGLPAIPEIRVCDNTDSLSKLGLDI